MLINKFFYSYEKIIDITFTKSYFDVMISFLCNKFPNFDKSVLCSMLNLGLQ